VVHAPLTPWTSKPEIHVLALFSPCSQTDGWDANKEVVGYKSHLTAKIIAANAIESLVGRVPVKKNRNEWVIVDRSGAFASTVLIDPESAQIDETM
jgi:hypothetical protein